MRKCYFRARGLGISLSLAMLGAGTAAAAELLEPGIVLPAGLGEALPPAQPVITPTADLLDEPVIAPPEAQPWIWAFTPRAWFLWETDHYFQKGEHRFQAVLEDPITGEEIVFDNPVNLQISNETTFIPFAGGSISVTPGLGAPTYSLTALYGEGSGRNSGLFTMGDAFFPSEFQVLAYQGEVSSSRLDIEAIAQVPAAEGFSWIVGARFIRFDRKEEGRLTLPPVIFGGAPTDVEVELTQHFYLGEAGFSLNRPVNADGSFVAFGNITGMLGFADVVHRTEEFGFFSVFNTPESGLQGGVFGVDANAGLGYRLMPNLFASARYRLFYLTAPDFDFRTGGTFMHGPEVNVTFSFGG